MTNCIQTSKKILALLRVRYTGKYLKGEVISHPHFPSLLTISDVLEKYKISHVPLKIGKDKLAEVPLPCIAQVAVRGKEFFHTLTHISEKSVDGYDELGIENKVSREDFLKMWTGVVLLVERNEDSAEPGIEERTRQDKIRKLLIGILALFVLLGLGMGIMELSGSGYRFLAFGYLVLKLIGLGISALVLWREIDKDNPLVQKFCSGGDKTDCNAVLDSTDLKFAEGALSPGSLAFSYFFAGFILLVTHSLTPTLFALVGWLSLATIPVVVISFYYQAFAIKKWCRFCLLLQGILLSEIVLAWIGQFYKGSIDLGIFSAFAVLFIGGLLGWMYLKPMLDAKDDIYHYKRNLKKIKNNPSIFGRLLTQSKKISNPTEGLGIRIKNKSPKYQVIKVCNPYCGPCAKAHPELERLVEEGSIDLQVLFFPNADMADPRTKTISHFLAIADKGDQQITRKALDQWYTSEQKDYTAFADAYPMNGELKQQEEKITAMKEWCEREGITHTPTIFINGYKLPEEYNIEDLKEIIT